MDFRRMTKVYWVVWAVVALIGPLAVAGPASAQTPTASIVGTVLDPQGLPVEGANVTLTNQGTNYAYNTTTSSTGAFQFSSIDSGLYRVTVSAREFPRGGGRKHQDGRVNKLFRSADQAGSGSIQRDDHG